MLHQRNIQVCPFHSLAIHPIVSLSLSLSDVIVLYCFLTLSLSDVIVLYCSLTLSLSDSLTLSLSPSLSLLCHVYLNAWLTNLIYVIAHNSTTYNLLSLIHFTLHLFAKYYPKLDIYVQEYNNNQNTYFRLLFLQICQTSNKYKVVN